jgi:predicted N-formylglutamate amidohydrolase
LATHWGWDPGAWTLTRALASQLGSPAVGGRWSRLWIDLNRDVDSPTLVCRDAEGQAIPWNSGLGSAEIARRVLACHVPYHAAIDALVARSVVHGSQPVVIAVHTFTPKLGNKERRFDLGMLYDIHESAARRVGREAVRAGLRVRYNQPYSGLRGMIYSAQRHGAARGLVYLEIELNQAVFSRPGAEERLASIMGPALERLSGAP